MTGYRHKILAIYLLYGPLFFPSDAANSADSYSAIPRIPFGWPMALSSEDTRVDHLGQEDHLSFALFSKYLNSSILYN